LPFQYDKPQRRSPNTFQAHHFAIVEGDADVAWRHDLPRKIGYKR
jgi:adenosine/AMP kinase